jgi:hypothetical protein
MTDESREGWGKGDRQEVGAVSTITPLRVMMLAGIGLGECAIEGRVAVLLASTEGSVG